MIVAAALAPLFNAPPALPPAAAAQARRAARAEPDDEAPTGPGWFDSSWDLRSGLTVVEHQHLHGDTLDLAVALWLQ